MRSYEASAKTKEEAIESGLEALGVGIGDVDITVLEEGSKGLFGLFGSRLAKVRLTVKEAEDDPLKGLLDESTAGKKPQAQKTERVSREAPKTDKKTADTPVKENRPAERKPAEKKPVEKQNAPKTEDKAEEVKTAKKAGTGRPVERKAERPVKAEAKKPQTSETTETVPVKALEKPEVTMIPDTELDPESAAGKAKAFLTQLTALMGVPVEIAMGTDADGNIYGQITGDTLGILIGRRGETLDAIQYLTSLKINKGQEGYTRVTLDTENYRAKREDTLVRLANRMANRAVKTGRRVSLEAMNPYERRIIHSALQSNEAVDTHSEGDEPNRHVVITLKK